MIRQGGDVSHHILLGLDSPPHFLDITKLNQVLSYHHSMALAAAAKGKDRLFSAFLILVELTGCLFTFHGLRFHSCARVHRGETRSRNAVEKFVVDCPIGNCEGSSVF